MTNKKRFYFSRTTDLIVVVFCIVFPQLHVVKFTFRVILCKTLKKEGRAFQNIETIH